MVKSYSLLALTACVGCGPVPQPESFRTVAAIEVPVGSEAQRKALTAILERHAAADGGIHVDEVSDRWRAFEADANVFAPADRGTLFIGVWRGAKDEDPEADVTDLFHPGRAWVTFARGRYPDRSTRFRKAVIEDIHRNWPDALPLPVLPTGGVPLAADLRRSPGGYKVTRSSAASYGLPTSSPLVEQE